MFKNMRLALKIGGGFGIVLVMTLGIAVISISGIRVLTVTNATTAASDRILDYMRTGIIAGKNYVILKDPVYQKDVELHMDKIEAEVRSMEKTLKDKESLDILKGVSAGAGGYANQLKEYASMQNEKMEFQNILDVNMTTLLKNVGQLHAIQRADLVILEKSNAPSARIIDRANKMDDVSNISSLVYQAGLTYIKFVEKQDSAYITTINETMAKVISETQKLGKVFQNEENQKLISEILVASDEFIKGVNNFVSLDEKQKIEQSKAAESGVLATKSARQINDLSTQKLVTIISFVSWLVFLASIAVLLIGVILSIFITRGITGAMRKGIEFATVIAGGDLTAELDIDQADEIGQLASALQEMIARLRKIVEEVNTASLNVSSGSNQLSTASQQISQEIGRAHV